MFIIGIKLFKNFFLKLKTDRKIFILFLTGVFAVGFTLTYFGLKIFKVPVKTAVDVKTSDSFVKAAPEPVETTQKGVFNVLLLGCGGGAHSGAGLTDSIIIAHIDSNTKKYVLVSVPRDLWIQGGRKLNAEASVNGYVGAESAIATITGLPINNYVAVSFADFVKLIDELGGVNIEVPAAFTDNLYPIDGEENNTCGKTEDEINTLKAQYSDFNLERQFTCRYETISYQKGPATLDGKTALKFVRSRHGDSDFGRSARQFAVLKGIFTKLVSLDSINKLDSAIETLFEMVKTDLTLGKIKTMIEAFGDTSTYAGTEIHLTTDNYLIEGKSGTGAYVLYPKAGNYNYSEIKSAILSAISQ